MIRSGILKDILKDSDFSVFLLDASGVLYNDNGAVPGIGETVKHLQSIGDVYLATNNSSQSPSSIVSNLGHIGLHIEESHILSSGLGLSCDPVIYSLIQNCRCYVVGYTDSFYYVRLAGGNIVDTLEDAEAIILTASIEASISHESVELLKFCHAHPEIPVICCNPDRFVRGVGHSKVSVIGYYAHLLELEIRNPFYWVGKPHSNYAHMVGRILTDHGIQWQGNTLFFDDNPDNVITMQNELNVIGCLVKETGISHEFSVAEMTRDYEALKWIIPALVL